MKWVVVAIVLFIGGYTVVNLWFRKPGKPAEPARDLRDRATAARLQESGWIRRDLPTHRPVDAPAVDHPAPVQRGAVGLGLDLDPLFVERPRLADTVAQVAAPATMPAGADYTFFFTAGHKDQHFQLGEVIYLHRGNELAVIPLLEPLPGKNLLSRWDDAKHAVTLPTQALKPGRYTVRLVATGPSVQWTLEVR